MTRLTGPSIAVVWNCAEKSVRLNMTLYGMLDYGQGFDPLLEVKLTPVFLSV